jgi:hypothetical protein
MLEVLNIIPLKKRGEKRKASVIDDVPDGKFSIHSKDLIHQMKGQCNVGIGRIALYALNYERDITDLWS